jgi:aspartate/methionine/tyrosine aminotransferase
MALKASKRGVIPPFIVMEVMRAAADRISLGGEVLHLSVGQPSTPAPMAVRAAAHAALDADLLGYTDEFGLPALREKLAGHYRRTQGVELPIERIALTVGSSGAFILGFLAAFDVGDRVALASPGYPAYRNILEALGVEVVELLAGPESGYQPTPALLDKVEGKLAGLIVASPANPTGAMLSRAEYQALVDYCRDRSMRLVSDEIYHGLTFEDSGVSALQLTQDALVVNSFSKYWSMTGWRLGWAVLPEDLLRSFGCLAQNFFISPPALAQHAAMAAFECEPELQANVARYRANRDSLVKSLTAAGITQFVKPQGAFYLYADVGHLTNDSQQFCNQMLADTGVAITPGVDFDPQRGARTVRLSFAGSRETIDEAGARIKEWVKRRG